MKKNYGNYLDFYKYLLHVELLASNTIKNEAKRKIKNLLRINLKYSSKFLAHKKQVIQVLQQMSKIIA